MKALLSASVGLVVVWCALPAAAADEVRERRVTFEARGTLLRHSLELLTSGTDTRITVDPRVPDLTVRMLLRDVTIDHALRLIVRQVSKQVPGLTYEASEEGFRLYVAEAAAPEEPERPERVTFTPRRVEPVKSPEERQPESHGASPEPAGPAPEIGAEPPRIDPTPALYRATVIPGNQGYFPLPEPPAQRRKRDALDTPIGRGAYKIDGIAKIVGIGPPWLKIRPLDPHYRDLQGQRGKGRRPPDPRQQRRGGGGGDTGNPDSNGGGGGGGGFGRRPF